VSQPPDLHTDDELDDLIKEVRTAERGEID